MIGTFILLKLIGLFVPLRMDDGTPAMRHEAAPGEEAYAIFADSQRGIPVLGD